MQYLSRAFWHLLKDLARREKMFYVFPNAFLRALPLCLEGTSEAPGKSCVALLHTLARPESPKRYAPALFLVSMIQKHLLVARGFGNSQ
jgi:hypothetical protein